MFSPLDNRVFSSSRLCVSQIKVSVCWEHWNFYEHFENTGYGLMCIILLFFILFRTVMFRCYVLRLMNNWMQMIPVRLNHSPYVLYFRNNSRCTQFKNLPFCASYLLVCSEFNSFLLFCVSSLDFTFPTFTILRYTLRSEKLMLTNTLISCYAWGNTLLGFSLTHIVHSWIGFLKM